MSDPILNEEFDAARGRQTAVPGDIEIVSIGLQHRRTRLSPTVKRWGPFAAPAVLAVLAILFMQIW